MKMRRVPLVLCLLCWGVLSWAWASNDEAVQISTRVDHARVKLGETVVVTEDVSYPRGVDIDLPKPESLALAPFEIRDATQVKLPGTADRETTRYTLQLAAYQNGKLSLPPLQIGYRDADGKPQLAQSPALNIEVERAASVPLPQTPTSASKSGAPAATVDIRDIKNPNPVVTPLWMRLSLAACLTVLLAMVVGFALWALRRRRYRLSAPATADALALAELDRLTAENLPAQGHLKLHYERLSHIVRSYLSRRFDLPILEHTTVEVVRMMTAVDGKDSLSDQVGPILSEADLIKFARQQVPADRALRQVSAARHLVETTRPGRDVLKSEEA